MDFYKRPCQSSLLYSQTGEKEMKEKSDYYQVNTKRIVFWITGNFQNSG